MKIIGKAEGSLFIVEMTKEEIAQIAGEGYSHLLHEILGRGGLEPGVVLEIGAKWKRLSDLDTKAKNAAGSIPDSLRMMAGLIEMAGTSLLPVEEGEKP